MEAGFAIQISTRNEGEVDGDFIHHTGDDFDSHFTSPHCLFFLQGSDMSGEKNAQRYGHFLRKQPLHNFGRPTLGPWHTYNLVTVKENFYFTALF